jgi:tetratricopeptide (TPR) repeat protein
MEIKEVLPFIFSGAAIIISIFSTFISLLQKNFETKRILRTQLTDITSELNDIVLEVREKAVKALQNIAGEQKPDIFMEGKLAMDSLKAMNLARQAEYIIKQLPSKLITDIEYSVMANTYIIINDIEQAEKHFNNSIKAALNNKYKALHMRSYGSFLYDSGKRKQANIIYSDAVKLIDVKHELDSYNLGYIYLDWATKEAIASSMDYAEELFLKCLKQYLTLNDLGLLMQTSVQIKSFLENFSIDKDKFIQKYPELYPLFLNVENRLK